ncbi:MAG TPA: MFS transporter [Candidatus Limnocylindria bacterium]|nr:MFS transporter [Candidatus Limnocylindria bacterium]
MRRRDFALLWFGGLISMTGDWLLLAALPFYVYSQTGSTVATALIITAELVPNFLLTTFAGVYVDRWDRKRVMVLTSLGSGLAVAGLLTTEAFGVLPVALAVVGTQAALSTLFGPAENALLPRLVEADELVTANALNALNNSLARLIGAPLGGIALAVWGINGVAILDAASFVLGAILIAAIHAPGRAEVTGEPAPAHFWREWREGLGLIVRTRTILALFVVLLLMNFGGVMTDPLFAAFVRDVVGAGPAVFGIVLTARAVGGMLGGVVAARLSRRYPTVDLLAAACIVAGGMQLIQFNLPLLPVVLTVSFLLGIPAVTSSAAVQTLLQERVPDAYRGRVFGSLSTMVALICLVSVLGFGGALASVIGIVPVLSLSALITASAGVAARVTLGEPRPAVPDAAEPAT